MQTNKMNKYSSMIYDLWTWVSGRRGWDMKRRLSALCWSLTEQKECRSQTLFKRTGEKWEIKECGPEMLWWRCQVRMSWGVLWSLLALWWSVKEQDDFKIWNPMKNKKARENTQAFSKAVKKHSVAEQDRWFDAGLGWKSWKPSGWRWAVKKWG